jgi:hypothetical protein
LFKTKKYRKFFPKKGPEKKALMFLSSLSRLEPRKAKEVYKKVLKSKSGKEKRVLLDARKTFKSRQQIFMTFDSLVNRYRREEPGFWGVIIFGGLVKKPTPPTDLDFIFVGKLSDSARAAFCSELRAVTGVPPNPFPVELDLRVKHNRFEELLTVPYLHSPREWTIQNFVGPIEYKRELTRAFRSALKRVKPAVEKVV